MKINGFFRYSFLAVLLMLFITGCHVHTAHSRSGKIPPGQAKKVSGSQSAKAYAPGQQKKR